MGLSSCKKFQKCAKNMLAHIALALSITYLSKLSVLSSENWIDSRCNCADHYSIPSAFILVAFNVCGFYTSMKPFISGIVVNYQRSQEIWFAHFVLLLYCTQ